MLSHRFRFYRFGLLVLAACLLGTAAPIWASEHRAVHQVTVPDEDRFTPFALTIRAGDTVRWINNDTDDHTVVSDDAFNTADNKGVDHLLAGTDSNGGKPGTFRLRFEHPGTFVFYCRFHARLDSSNQPTAPGPRDGIQNMNNQGGPNFGTPMMGVITVLPAND